MKTVLVRTARGSFCAKRHDVLQHVVDDRAAHKSGAFHLVALVFAYSEREFHAFGISRHSDPEVTTGAGSKVVVQVRNRAFSARRCHKLLKCCHYRRRLRAQTNRNRRIVAL
jgi:hypothetical protein